MPRALGKRLTPYASSPLLSPEGFKFPGRYFISDLANFMSQMFEGKWNSFLEQKTCYFSPWTKRILQSTCASGIRTRLFSFGLGCSQATKAFESKCTYRYTAWADQCGWQPCRADSTRVFHLPMIRLGGAEMGSYLANFIGLFYLFCYYESWYGFLTSH